MELPTTIKSPASRKPSPFGLLLAAFLGSSVMWAVSSMGVVLGLLSPVGSALYVVSVPPGLVLMMWPGIDARIAAAGSVARAFVIVSALFATLVWAFVDVVVRDQVSEALRYVATGLSAASAVAVAGAIRLVFAERLPGPAAGRSVDETS